MAGCDDSDDGVRHCRGAACALFSHHRRGAGRERRRAPKTRLSSCSLQQVRCRKPRPESEWHVPLRGRREGRLQVRAQGDGFKPISMRVRVAARAPAAQKIVLPLAQIAEDVTVTTGEALTTQAADNRGAIVLDPDALANLPIFDPGRRGRGVAISRSGRPRQHRGDLDRGRHGSDKRWRVVVFD